MAEFVLVAGAWLGAWAWDDVVPALRAAGHGAHPVTLSGLAERSSVPAGQETHVQDIVDVVEGGDLSDVVVVGHSYSGIPVGQAASRIGGRLKRVVFVDSNVPADGESFTSFWSPSQVAELTDRGFWPPLAAEDFAGQGLSDASIARIVGGATPHPAASLTEPASVKGSLADLPATYIKCLLDGDTPSPDVAELLKSDRWELVEMETGHWPMVSQPAELARILLAVA
ncbi:alpha/beta fold hydrolase [Amycolatopsis sp. NPDC004378]